MKETITGNETLTEKTTPETKLAEKTTPETKSEKFVRLAENRVNKILHDFDILANLSNRGNYVYSRDHIDTMFHTIRVHMDEAEAKFSKSDDVNTKFTFSR